LDASKAFDRVEYGKLFQLLLDRNLPPQIIRLLLNMYTNQQVRVLWNGVYSLSFSVSNGVKQGAIISPILFCVYLDALLVKSREAGVGCYIAGCYVGALAYADDLVLMTPSASAMRRMLSICDRFSSEYNVSFNVNKTKCLNFRPISYVPGKESPPPSFSLGGNIIENVCQWPHLGHMITAQCSDSTDIIERKDCFVGQVNNMLCHFAKLDSLVKCRLFTAYCSSFYGSELWNLDNSEINSLCVAWRKGMRQVWGLPVDTSSNIVYLIADSILYTMNCVVDLIILYIQL
jgi:Reverse transcriptase (RNA-dependent DNA polymerase)